MTSSNNSKRRPSPARRPASPGPRSSSRPTAEPSRHGRNGPVSGADSRFIGSFRAAAAPPPPVQPLVVTRIEQVQSALGDILQWSSAADTALSTWLRAHRQLGMRDRSEVAEAVYDALRHLRRYQHLASMGKGPAARRLAILALDATLAKGTLDNGLTEEEDQWLQAAKRVRDDDLPRAVRDSLPDWLDEKLGLLPDADQLVAALNRPASLDIRVNPMTAQRDKMLAGLRAGPGAKFEPRATPFSPWGIRLNGRPAINRWPQFERGDIEVQDEGSQLLALLVGPKRGEMVIDFCAGAGGKTLLLGALMRSTGRLYAFDVSAKRLARAKPRFARSGLSNVVPVVIDSENDVRVKRLAGKAQRVLVDAPCSGIGTLRRNPDLKWRQHPGSLAELCDLQRRILSSAARCVALGGRLVYATCSLLPEENAMQAEQFLAAHPEFSQVDVRDVLDERSGGLTSDGPMLQLRPDAHGTDGFFAAIFERRSPASAGVCVAAIAAVVAAGTEAQEVIARAASESGEALDQEVEPADPTPEVDQVEAPKADPVGDAAESTVGRPTGDRAD